jgi:predicted nucleic acid-binding protein
MKLLDVNILVGVHREEAAQHEELKTWLEKRIKDPGLRWRSPLDDE